MRIPETHLYAQAGGGIIFISRADLLNNGHPDQEDLFFADISDPFNPVFYQLTNTPDDEEFPSISEDCSTIAFESESDFTGSNQNNLRQLFIGDISNLNNPIYTQITDNMVNQNIGGYMISGDGTKVGIISNLDLAGMNPMLHSVPFIFDWNNNVDPFAILTDDIFSSRIGGPSINPDGSRYAFSSSSNYNPPNMNPGEAEQIYLIELFYNSPNLPNTNIHQITNIPNDQFGATSVTLSGDGNTISFVSNFNITGMNPSQTEQLYIARVTNPAAPQFFQVTQFSQNSARRPPVINTNGTKLAFETSNPQITRTSDDNEQIAMADMSDPENPVIMALTSFMGGSDIDDLTTPGDLSFIVFESESDLIPGGNTDENEELYMLFPDNCALFAVPTLSEWGLVAMAGILGIVGFMVIRRRQVTA